MFCRHSIVLVLVGVFASLMVDGKDGAGSSSSAPPICVVRHLDKDKYSNISKLLLENLPKDDPVLSHFGAHKEKAAKEYFRAVWWNVLHLHLSVGCYTDKNELIGINLLYIQDVKGGSPINLPKKTPVTITRMAKFIDHLSIDIEKKYKVKKYLTCTGLYVDSKRDRVEVATQLLKFRQKICDEKKLNVTSSIFPSYDDNLAATNAGFESGADAYTSLPNQETKVTRRTLVFSARSKK